jgi:hypothetical protein
VARELIPRRGGRWAFVGRGSLLRSAALLAAGVLLLHHGSYSVGFSEHEEEEVVSNGHAYFSFLTPLVALLVMLAAGHFTRAVLQARRTGQSDTPPPMSFLRAWLGASSALCAVHVSQESLE